MDRNDLLDRLCAALPDGSACGDHLEYDPAFLALDQAAARAERVAVHLPTATRSQRIENADDVRRRLEEICEYYVRCEPSSPVPLLLQRARRLVGGDFLALLRDLAPGGMDEMERVVGRAE